jgi:hypothetical protein
MNVEIGTEAALFPEKEYINGIFLAVHIHKIIVCRMKSVHICMCLLYNTNKKYVAVSLLVRGKLHDF